MCGGCGRTADTDAAAKHGEPCLGNGAAGPAGTGMPSELKEATGMVDSRPHHEGLDGAGESAALAAYCSGGGQPADVHRGTAMDARWYALPRPT